MKKIKDLFSNLIKGLKTPGGIKKLGAFACIILALLLVIKAGSTAYEVAVSKKLECKYESAVSDYSKIKIEETVTNVFKKDKRAKMIQKTVYTILDKDKDTLSSMKADKKMYTTTFNDIKGASATYKVKGYTITTKATYNLNKIDDNKLNDLSIDKKQTYDDIKKYYEGYGYTCK